MKHEGGPHRVQRVPVTESQGRIHTSSATVTVLPEAEEVDVAHRPQRPADRRLPLVGPGWAVGEHHRLGRAHHPQADRAGRGHAGREEPDPEPGQGHAGAAGPAAQARAGPAGGRAVRRPARARSAAAGARRRSAPTTSRRTGSPTTASGSRSTSSTRCWPASSTRSSTRSSPTSAAASCRMTTSPPDGRAGPPIGRRSVDAELERHGDWRQLQAEARRRRDAARPGGRRRPAHRRGGRRASRAPSYVLGLRRAGDRPVAWPRFDAMVERRLAGEPLQYVLGRVGLPHARPARRPPGADPPARDRGGGRLGARRARPAARRGDRSADRSRSSTSAPGRGPSRCRWPPSGRDVEVWATDVSADALDVARANLAGLGRAGAAGPPGRGVVVRRPAGRAPRPGRPGRQQPALRGGRRRRSRPRSRTGSRPAPSSRARPGSRRCCRSWTEAPRVAAPGRRAGGRAGARPGRGRGRGGARRGLRRGPDRDDLSGRPRAVVPRLIDPSAGSSRIDRSAGDQAVKWNEPVNRSHCGMVLVDRVRGERVDRVALHEDDRLLVAEVPVDVDARQVVHDGGVALEGRCRCA